MSEVHRTTETGVYFKRGARVTPKQRKAIIEANIRPAAPRGEAYALAMANMHKPWARRYLRELRFVP